MDPWTMFWIAVLLIIVWTCRHMIAVAILAFIAAIAGGLGLATFSAFDMYGKFDDWKHRRKYKLKK